MKNATAYSLIRPYDSDYRLKLIEMFMVEREKMLISEYRQAVANGLVELI